MKNERDDSDEIYIWDMPGPRRVELETDFGFEIHYVYAPSNMEALKKFYRPGVNNMVAIPLFTVPKQVRL
jgi:hypothetical protein